MDWWILELITTAVLVAIAFWLGPLIKRFGRSYAADVFRANPRTGKSFIMLTDVAYYLIFFSYILFTVSFEPKGSLGRHRQRRPAPARDGARRRHPADHRPAARRQPAGAAGDGPAADAQPPPRRVVDVAPRPEADRRAMLAVQPRWPCSPSSAGRAAPATTTRRWRRRGRDGGGGARRQPVAPTPVLDRLAGGDVLDVSVVDGTDGANGVGASMRAHVRRSHRVHEPIPGAVRRPWSTPASSTSSPTRETAGQQGRACSSSTTSTGSGGRWPCWSSVRRPRRRRS